MANSDSVDLLAIAAHPDDVELSCAGTVIAAKHSGKRAAIVDLTRGELSTRGTLEIRARETEEATKIMGLDHRINLGMFDGNIELSQNNLLKLVAAIRRFRPTVMITPHKQERHPDHVAASELAYRAGFYAGLLRIETFDDDGNMQEPHRPLLTLQYMQTHVFEPTIIIDVTEVFPVRLEAMRAYASQFARPKLSSADDKNPRQTAAERVLAEQRQTFLTQAGFYEWIEARARNYGMMIGVEYGEPFWTSQPLGTKDLFGLVTKGVA
jgi:bacillithiol biosynthesis deacetylase BshB1